MPYSRRWVQYLELFPSFSMASKGLFLALNGIFLAVLDSHFYQELHISTLSSRWWGSPWNNGWPCTELGKWHDWECTQRWVGCCCRRLDCGVYYHLTCRKRERERDDVTTPKCRIPHWNQKLVYWKLKASNLGPPRKPVSQKLMIFICVL